MKLIMRLPNIILNYYLLNISIIAIWSKIIRLFKFRTFMPYFNLIPFKHMILLNLASSANRLYFCRGVKNQKKSGQTGSYNLKWY